jgi:hypothetical protein
VTPRMCTARAWTSMTKKTHRRRSSTVSTCKKSRARRRFLPEAGCLLCREWQDAQAPVWHLHKLAGGELTILYLDSFERVWESATPVEGS